MTRLAVQGTNIVRERPTLWDAGELLGKVVGRSTAPPRVQAAGTGGIASVAEAARDVAAIRMALLLPARLRTGEPLEVLEAFVNSLELKDERLNGARHSQPGWTASFCRAMKIISKKAGEALFQQGDMGEHMFIVLTGSVGIYRANKASGNGQRRGSRLLKDAQARRASSRLPRARSGSVARTIDENGTPRPQTPSMPTPTAAARRRSSNHPPLLGSSRRGTRTGSLLPRPENADLSNEDEEQKRAELLEEVGEVYGTLLVTCGPGALFGELALLYAQARAASAIVLEPSEFVVIHRTEFERMTRRDQKATASKGASLLHSIPEFSRCAHSELVQLQYNFREVSIGPGHHIVDAGYACNDLIVVRRGLVTVRVPARGELPAADVGHFGPGTVLGDVDTSVQAAAFTVVTVEPTELLVITKPTLHRFASAPALEHMKALCARRAEEWRRRQIRASEHLARSRANALLRAKAETNGQPPRSGAGARTGGEQGASGLAPPDEPAACVEPDASALNDACGLVFDETQGLYVTVCEAIIGGLPLARGPPKSAAERARPSTSGGGSRLVAGSVSRRAPTAEATEASLGGEQTHSVGRRPYEESDQASFPRLAALNLEASPRSATAALAVSPSRASSSAHSSALTARAGQRPLAGWVAPEPGPSGAQPVRMELTVAKHGALCRRAPKAGASALSPRQVVTPPAPPLIG